MAVAKTKGDFMDNLQARAYAQLSMAKNMEAVGDYVYHLQDICSKRSAQIGDLKNKLIKAQQEIIELRKEVEKLYKLKDLKTYAV